MNFDILELDDESADILYIIFKNNFQNGVTTV